MFTEVFEVADEILFNYLRLIKGFILNQLKCQIIFSDCFSKS